MARTCVLLGGCKGLCCFGVCLACLLASPIAACCDDLIREELCLELCLGCSGVHLQELLKNGICQLGVRAWVVERCADQDQVELVIR